MRNLEQWLSCILQLPAFFFFFPDISRLSVASHPARITGCHLRGQGSVSSTMMPWCVNRISLDVRRNKEQRDSRKGWNRGRAHALLAGHCRFNLWHFLCSSQVLWKPFTWRAAANQNRQSWARWVHGLTPYKAASPMCKEMQIGSSSLSGLTSHEALSCS